MKLKKLTIEIGRSYEAHAGQYKSEIEYEGGSGSVTLQLDCGVSNALLVCIGETISKFAAEASRRIEADIHQSLSEATNNQPLIESP
jgi:hypothetical protein